MTVAGLKEANLQHCNEIRPAAFVSDTEQCLKKQQKKCGLCICGPSSSLLCLEAGMVLPRWSSSAFLWKVTGNRQVCKTDAEPINQELLVQ